MKRMRIMVFIKRKRLKINKIRFKNNQYKSKITTPS